MFLLSDFTSISLPVGQMMMMNYCSFNLGLLHIDPAGCMVMGQRWLTTYLVWSSPAWLGLSVDLYCVISWSDSNLHRLLLFMGDMSSMPTDASLDLSGPPRSQACIVSGLYVCHLNLLPQAVRSLDPHHQNSLVGLPQTAS